MSDASLLSFFGPPVQFCRRAPSRPECQLRTNQPTGRVVSRLSHAPSAKFTGSLFRRCPQSASVHPCPLRSSARIRSARNSPEWCPPSSPSTRSSSFRTGDSVDERFSARCPVDCSLTHKAVTPRCCVTALQGLRRPNRMREAFAAFTPREPVSRSTDRGRCVAHSFRRRCRRTVRVHGKR